MSDEISTMKGINPWISGGLGLAGAGLTAISSPLINYHTQKKFLQMQQNFVEKQNAIMREREDNAIQRQMRDLQLAGINPLMAGGFSNGAGADFGGQLGLATGFDSANAFNSATDSITNALNSTANINSKNYENKLKLAEIDEILDDLLKNNPKAREEADKRISKMSAEIADLASIALQRLYQNEKLSAETKQIIAETALTNAKTSTEWMQYTKMVNDEEDRDYYNANIRPLERLQKIKGMDLQDYQMKQISQEILESMAKVGYIDSETVLNKIQKWQDIWNLGSGIVYDITRALLPAFNIFTKFKGVLGKPLDFIKGLFGKKGKIEGEVDRPATADEVKNIFDDFRKAVGNGETKDKLDNLSKFGDEWLDRYSDEWLDEEGRLIIW